MSTCSKRAYVSTIVCLILAGFPGCRPTNPTGTVAGHVTLNGAPFAEAAVVFLSLQTGGGGTADLGADGSFTLPKPLRVGEYRVYLAPKVSIAPSGDTAPVPVTMNKSVPDKYWSESSTDIVATVKVGTNDVQVALSR